MPFAWHDLLGTPWMLHGRTKDGMDCSTVAEEVLSRLGYDPPASNPYRLEGSAGEQGEIGAYLGLLEAAYTRLGSEASLATERGDLVLCADEGGLARHLYILVEPARGTFLTASHDHGVIAVRRFMLRQVAGVYRPKEAAWSR